MNIPLAFFRNCILCGCTKQDLTKSYPGRANGAYYVNKFCRHLASFHDIDLRTYCERYLGVWWPRCPVSGVPVGYKATGKGVKLATYKKGVGITRDMSPAFRASCERQKELRKGDRNPMYGKEPWNKRLRANDPYRAKMAAKRRGVREGPATRLKQSQNRANHPLKARHTTSHTAVTKAKIAECTAKMHARHAFRRESFPHIRVRLELAALGVVFTEEYPIGRFCADFASLDKKVVLEVDGDWWHTNPAYYPEGPTHEIQIRNAKNDRVKNAYLKERGWKVERYWESEILAPGFTAKLKADLVRLSILEG